MKYRKLRIAWSVAWGVLTVLLIVLWVRSGWCSDTVYEVSASETSWLTIDYGMIKYSHEQWLSPTTNSPYGAIGWHRKVTYYSPKLSNLVKHIVQPFVFKKDFVTIPTWFLVLISSALATAPWLRRFNLRTLLITTTLVAMGLGLIVWAAR